MNTSYENAGLRNPKPELLDPAHTAARNNTLDGLISRAPTFATVSVLTDCPIHGTQSWLVTKQWQTPVTCSAKNASGSLTLIKTRCKA